MHYKLILFFLLLVSNIQAQKYFWADKKDILIGEKIQLNIITEKQNTVVIPDTIPHFEVIANENKDTSINNLVVKNTIVNFTSFDSGSFYFPTLKNLGGALVTDSILINVNYMPMDKGNAVRDIKTIIEVDYFDWTLYKNVGLLLLLLIGAFIIWRKIFRKKTTSINSVVNPYKEAVKAIEKLSIQNENKEVSIDELYTRLITILKNYFSTVDKSNINSNTSEEVIKKLGLLKLNAEIALQAQEALQTADATKFAKYQPAQSENVSSIQFVNHTIDELENLKNKN